MDEKPNRVNQINDVNDDESLNTSDTISCNWFDDDSSSVTSEVREPSGGDRIVEQPKIYEHCLSSDDVDSDLGEMLESSSSVNSLPLPPELDQTAPLTEFCDLPDVCSWDVEQLRQQVDEVDIQLQSYLQQKSLVESAKGALLLPAGEDTCWRVANIQPKDDATIHAPFKKVAPRLSVETVNPKCTSTPKRKMSASTVVGSQSSKSSELSRGNTTDDLCLVLIDDDDLELLSSHTQNLAISSDITSSVEIVRSPNLSIEANGQELRSLFDQYCKLVGIFGSDRNLAQLASEKITFWAELFSKKVCKVLELYEFKRKLFVTGPLGKDPADLFRGKTLHELSWKLSNELQLNKLLSIPETKSVVGRIKLKLRDVLNDCADVQIGKLFVVLSLISDVLLNIEVPSIEVAGENHSVLAARITVARGWEQLAKKGLSLKNGNVNWQAIGLSSEQAWRTKVQFNESELFQAKVENVRSLAAAKLLGLSVDDTLIQYGSTPHQKCSIGTNVDSTDLLATKKASVIRKYSKFKLGPVGQLIPFTPRGFVYEDVKFLSNSDFELFNKIAYKSYVSPHLKFKKVLARSSAQYKAKCVQIAEQERLMQKEIGEKLLTRRSRDSVMTPETDNSIPVKKVKTSKNPHSSKSADLERLKNEQFKNMKAQFERFTKAKSRSRLPDFPNLPVEVWEEAGFDISDKGRDDDPSCSYLQK